MPHLFPLLNGDPTEISGYRITGRLGSGGQGVVYLGVDADGEQAAVKMLRVEDDTSRTQFAKEVANARRVAPFCTAQILDFDVDSASPYVISEFIEGSSLQQFVAARGPLSGPRLQRLAIGTATALTAIHLAGVVHRDLKPGNVMMSPEGPRVIDFGIARDLSSRTTVAGGVFGTPAYMSPEQLRGERVGPASDLFSWASVIVFAAVGRAPFATEHPMASINKIAHEEPDLSGVPWELQAVLRRCFSKQAEHRPTAQQALAMLLGRPGDADTPSASAVLAAGTEFVEAGADSLGTGSPATVWPRALDVSGENPTWDGTTPVVSPPITGAGPAPSRRKRLTVVTVGVLAVLAAGLLGVDIYARTNSAPTSSPTPGTPASTAAGTPTSTDDAGVQVPDGTLPAVLAGTWTGTVTQHSATDDEWQWLVELDLTAGLGDPGTMKATDLDCVSYVTVTRVSATSAHLRAPVLAADNPQGSCASLGEITVKLNQAAGTLNFVWQDSDDPTNTGRATLSRVNG
ncbi:protein kinase [Kineosporia sp. J2-2]|uniref:Protein kinase n=1 Tax=Kineosporia corallincola TaxID=2835133 RepID=A0ABS5TAX7_9ACTN|nr:protein kinase [Kineosporia corallincola]MBT0768228.1 protein kinase [Kineosporia corallincola]